jgi:hypothetical protein
MQHIDTENLVVKTQGIEETEDGCPITVIFDDGVSILENLGMAISTPSGYVFYIDPEDYPRVSEFRWWVSSDGKGRMYVHTTIGSKKVYLHRFIRRAPDGQKVDHRNGDALDNRKSNLRLATHQQNMFNKKKHPTHRGKPTSSPYKGVTWDRSRTRFKAQIMKDGVNHNLGCFPDESSAALAYDLAAIEMFGEFAQTNFGWGK